MMALEEQRKKIEKYGLGGPVRVFSLPQQDHFYLEWSFLLVFALFFLNFFIGRHSNQKLLSLWAKNHVKLFVDQFSNIDRHVNHQDQSSRNSNGLPFNTNSMTEYYMYCTGRKNVDLGCMVTIELKKRHDLLRVLLSYVPLPKSLINLLSSSSSSSSSSSLSSPSLSGIDFITLDIAVSSSVFKEQPCVFALVDKQLESVFLSRESPDIARLANKYYITKDSEHFPSNRVLYTDCNEFRDLSNKLMIDWMTQLKRYQDLLLVFYLSSDNNRIYPEHDTNLRVVMKLPTTEHDMVRLNELTQLVFHVVDTLPKLKLEPKQREANLVLRRKLKEERMNRIEKIKQEKMEKLRKEKEQQEKLNAKELRKRAKKVAKTEGKKPKLNLVYS